MTFFTGDAGRLWLASPGSDAGGDASTAFSNTANVQSWSVSWSQAMIERNALGYTDRVISPGIRSLSGNAKILYYREPAPAAGTGTDDEITLPKEGVSWLLKQCIKPSNTAYKQDESINDDDGDPKTNQSKRIGFKLGVRNGGTSRFIAFYGFITAISMGCNVGEVVTADITFEADGAPYKMTF